IHLLLSSVHREGDTKDRVAGTTLESYPTAVVLFDNVLADRKSQAEAGAWAPGGHIEVENAFSQRLRHAGACICHLDHGMVALLTTRYGERASLPDGSHAVVHEVSPDLDEFAWSLEERPDRVEVRLDENPLRDPRFDDVQRRLEPRTDVRDFR